jgi:hypothetical protein
VRMRGALGHGGATASAPSGDASDWVCAPTAQNPPCSPRGVIPGLGFQPVLGERTMLNFVSFEPHPASSHSFRGWPHQHTRHRDDSGRIIAQVITHSENRSVALEQGEARCLVTIFLRGARLQEVP